MKKIKIKTKEELKNKIENEIVYFKKENGEYILIGKKEKIKNEKT